MKIKLLEELKQLLSEIKENKDDETDLEDGYKDVSDVFICIYDDSNVGLFNQKVINEFTASYLVKSNCIYIGTFSDIIGIKNLIENEWRTIGYNAYKYVANCNMQDSMSFDDVRLIMYSNGIIDAYEPGKATIQEMLEVLKYAFTYYELDDNKQMKKA